MERRLAAILFYDLVGFSRAMSVDEAGTLEALKNHRREVIDAKAEQHHGRTIKLLGDGALMEFPSVVGALTFAVSMQCGMAERNARLPPERRLLYRIGLNVCDVIVDGDDVFGDGVNIATRLEALAEPGGICVRRNVRNHVRGKVPLDFRDMGEVRIKNIDEPVRAFQVELNRKAQALAGFQEQPPADRNSRRRLQTGAGVAAVALLVAGLVSAVLHFSGIGWWQP